MKRLADPAETAVILVSRPDASALREAERTRNELAGLGVSNIRLAINGLFRAERDGDAIADAMTRRAAEALVAMPASLAALPGTAIPFLPRGTVGLDALRAMARPDTATEPSVAAPAVDVALPRAAWHGRRYRPDGIRRHHDHG